MLVPSPIPCPSNSQFLKRNSKLAPSSLKAFPPPGVRNTTMLLNNSHSLADAKSLFRPFMCIPTPAKPLTEMSSKVELRNPVLKVELESTKKPSSLVFPAEPYSRKPERDMLVTGLLFVWGMTKTGLLPFMDCKVVPLQGAATLHVGLPFTPPDAPIPTIFKAFRRVICCTVKV